MKIGSLDLNNTNVTVIAEAGVNHNGDMNIAKKLIESAAKSGAKIIKFQTYKAEKLTRIKPIRIIFDFGFFWKGRIYLFKINV